MAYFQEIRDDFGSIRMVETEMTKEELQLKLNIQELSKQLENIKDVLGDALMLCDHRACFDEQGWTYDIRKCAICGYDLGLV